ncbi:MAG: hydrogenase maturation protease [bacterium]|nr:hydrogenase maturation protease [bacterium]
MFNRLTEPKIDHLRRTKPFLILGLGNELLADDAAGILVVKELASSFFFQPFEPFFETVLCSESGVTLLDYFSGYQKAIVVDSIHSPNYPVGESIEIPIDNLQVTYAPSPHYSGLTELQQLAKEMDIPFPNEIRIVAIPVEDPYTIGKPLSESTYLGIQSAKNKCLAIAESWIKSYC